MESGARKVPNEYWFDHEKLEVYQDAIAFVAWLSPLLDGSGRIGEIKDQLDRASSSIALNIAEGNGKYSPKDRCRFFDIAHGLLTRMRSWSGRSRRESEADARPDPAWKTASSKNSPNACGIDQKKFDPRLQQR